MRLAFKATETVSFCYTKEVHIYQFGNSNALTLEKHNWWVRGTIQVSQLTLSLTWPESVSQSPGSLVRTSSGCRSSSKITSFVSCTLRFCHCSVNMRNMCYFAFACFSIRCLNQNHKLMTFRSKLPSKQVMNNSISIPFFVENIASIEITSAGRRWLSSSIVPYLSLTDETTNCLV